MSDTLGLALIAMIGTSIASTVAAVLAYLKSRANSEDIRSLHIVVNSRLTQLLASTQAAALAEGKIAGAASQQFQSDVTAQDILLAAKLRRDQEFPPAEPPTRSTP